MGLLISTLVVLCIGDSITAWTDSYCDQSVHLTHNVGVNSTLTETWADPAYFDAHAGAVLEVEDIDVVSIMLSTNDASREHTPESVKANMETIVDHIRSYGDYDIVVSLPPYFPRDYGVSVLWSEILDSFRPGLFEVIDENPDVRLGVDWTEWDLPYPDVWDDAVHPSAEGHAIISPEFDEVILVPEPNATLQLIVAGSVLALMYRRKGES